MSEIKEYWDHTYGEAIQGLLPYLSELRDQKDIGGETIRDAMAIGIKHIFGTATELSRQIHSTSTTVNKWLDGKEEPSERLKKVVLDVMIRNIVELKMPQVELLKHFQAAIAQTIESGPESEEFTDILRIASRHLYRGEKETSYKLKITEPTYWKWSDHYVPHQNTQKRVLEQISKDLDATLSGPR